MVHSCSPRSPDERLRTGSNGNRGVKIELRSTFKPGQAPLETQGLGAGRLGISSSPGFTASPHPSLSSGAQSPVRRSRMCVGPQPMTPRTRPQSISTIDAEPRTGSFTSVEDLLLSGLLYSGRTGRSGVGRVDGNDFRLRLTTFHSEQHQPAGVFHVSMTAILHPWLHVQSRLRQLGGSAAVFLTGLS
jgi:hypothetical protein